MILYLYLKNVCEALAKFGHEITIYSGNPLPRVEDNISVIEVETPQYFDTFDFGKRIELFRTRKKDLFEFPLRIIDFVFVLSLQIT